MNPQTDPLIPMKISQTNPMHDDQQTIVPIQSFLTEDNQLNANKPWNIFSNKRSFYHTYFTPFTDEYIHTRL